MPFCASVQEAASHAPQLGTFSSTTTPSTTQATFLWNRAFDYIRIRLRRAGISSTFTASSAGEGWAKSVESLLLSGYALRAKGSVGRRGEGSRAGGAGDTTAERLLKEAHEELDRLDTDRALRASLIKDSGEDNAPISGWAVSNWKDNKDPDFDTNYGGESLLYIPGAPVIQDGEPL